MTPTPWQTLRTICYSLFLLACLPAHTQAASPTIVTTLPPLASLVTWLAPQASVHCLLPASADPHHFQLTPRQVELLHSTPLFIRSTRDDGAWQGLKASGTTLDLWPSSHATHSEPDEHHHTRDNHAWLNPNAVIHILPQLSQALIQVYPKQREHIEANTRQAEQSAMAILHQWQQTSQALNLQTHGVFMQHPAWLGLFETLHIPVWSILESAKHGQERGPRALEQALSLLKQHPQAWLIADVRHNNRALQWLQRHNPTSSMRTLDALGDANAPWPEFMQRNLAALQHP